ncbi:MAG: hypothetical protein ACP5N1_03095 [Candidatus Woesearchaeota archaeon]
METIKQLESILGVECGDLIICTYHTPFTQKGTSLSIGTGIYNPYQGISGNRLGPRHVDLAHNAKQRADLVKSDDCFRVHLLGSGYGDKSQIYNVDGMQTQIPVNHIIDFKIVMKSSEVTEFYKKAI